jgi:hypothetical protein
MCTLVLLQSLCSFGLNCEHYNQVSQSSYAEA